MTGASELKPSDGKVRLRVKTGPVRGLLVLGIGAGGSMALVLGLLQVIAHDPKDGVALLKAWGPWALIVGFVIFVAWKVAEKAMEVVTTGLEAWVRTAEKGAEAQSRTADALTRLAEDGGRSYDEMKRLSVYAAQEFPTLYDRFDRQDDVLRGISKSLGAITEAMLTLSTKVNEGIQQQRREGR